MEIIIPEAVAHEIKEAADSDPGKKWLEEEGKVYVRDVGTLDSTVSSWKLGPGESEVISCVNRNPLYEAIVDDQAARRCAATLGLQVRGTIGVLLAAKNEGLIPALEPVLGIFGIQVSASPMRLWIRPCGLLVRDVQAEKRPL
jgi:predicted nucleic acid-binding protein